MADSRTLPAIYLAHDHMDRPEDFTRDLDGGVTGKILHLVVDSWFDAPTRDEYEASYYGYDGFLERGLVAVARALGHEDEPGNRVRVVRGSGDLERAREQNELALILGTEGGKLIQEDLGLLKAFFRLGLRHIQFNWAMRNQIGASQANEDEPDEPGLTEFGRSVVQAMNEMGMIIDVSHSAAATIRDVIEITEKPVLNSHSGSRELAPKPQNLWDDQIRAMAENGGVIGVHFCSRLVLGVDDRQSEIGDVVRQIRYLTDTGGIDVVGLGPDFVLGNAERDARYKRNTDQGDISWTRGLESSAEIGNLFPDLEDGGFSPGEIDKIAGGNMLRLFNEVLPA